PELGRENPQRRWYCVSRRGRVGRRQAIKAGSTTRLSLSPNPPIPAGWSSPVARQAHNLKVIGSNPIPATTNKPLIQTLNQRPSLARDVVLAPGIPNG